MTSFWKWRSLKLIRRVDLLFYVWKICKESFSVIIASIHRNPNATGRWVMSGRLGIHHTLLTLLPSSGDASRARPQWPLICNRLSNGPDATGKLKDTGKVHLPLLPFRTSTIATSRYSGWCLRPQICTLQMLVCQVCGACGQVAFSGQSCLCRRLSPCSCSVTEFLRDGIRGTCCLGRQRRRNSIPIFAYQLFDLDCWLQVHTVFAARGEKRTYHCTCICSLEHTSDIGGIV